MTKHVTLIETAILRDTRQTAKDLGITDSIRRALACECLCPACRPALELALHDLTLARDRDAGKSGASGKAF